MSYNINFSDPSKSTNITVPDMSPGINAVDTSLEFVGRGYPNYGQSFNSNFLHLLENFASPYPGPRQPIEGQLWYDTTDPMNKVLRVRDGGTWVSANGIYQQGSDPSISSSSPAELRPGDIWVDTANYQLKIFNGGDWTLVGPMVTGGSKTGVDTAVIEDNSEYGSHSIVKFWANGSVIAIVASETFTPRIIIPGFTKLVPGINLRNTGTGPNVAIPEFNGVSNSALKLQINGEDISAGFFLRKDDNRAGRRQVISGKVFFKTPNDTSGSGNEINGLGRDGIVINNETSTDGTKYIQFYKGNTDAIILTNDPSGSIVLKAADANGSLTTIGNFSASETSIDTPVALGGSLTVAASSTITGSLHVGNSVSIDTTLSVGSTTVLGADLTLNGDMHVEGDLLPVTPNAHNIGSNVFTFDQVFARTIGTPASNLYGTLHGTVSSLTNATVFRLEGHVTSQSFNYNGQATSATFTATLSSSAILDQIESTQVSRSMNMLVVDTSTNAMTRINYDIFTSGVLPTGMIMPYAGDVNNPPPGWLYANGDPIAIADYPVLHNVIGVTYNDPGPGLFGLPNPAGILSTGTAITTIRYIIKT